jgi:serine protein kinase
MASSGASHEEIERVSASVRERFLAEKRLLSYDDYVEELVAHPYRHSRDAARYLKDCFDHYGSYELPRPVGAIRRFKLFDQRFDGAGSGSGQVRLSGHEELQNAFYRALGNFVREGRANKLVLLHGPNGSAKSTFADCLMRALEHYSTTPEGAVYRFAWVFSSSVEDRTIGFGSTRSGQVQESLAHLEPDRISAKLVSELREHPLLILPLEERRKLLERTYAAKGVKEAPPDWLWNGRLGRKNAGIFDALLASYGGDLERVLSHVQVERFHISRRYRTGAVTIGPQMSVDASERQITMDRSIGELPAALASIALYETQGELVDGQGGIVEFSDLLKRPLDAWKYLLLAIEAGEVALTMSMLTVNAVLVASTNEVHLEAFRQHHEYNSFRARLLPLRAGYLLDYKREQEIYDGQVVSQLRQHVTPHATFIAALFGVLTRLLPSQTEHFEDSALGKLAAELTPLEKARLYADGEVPRRLGTEQAKILRSSIGVIYRERDSLPDYEGLQGASARELRTVLLDAAQHPSHACLSPLAVLEQLQGLVDKGDYDFLRIKPEGAYHAAKELLSQTRAVWIDRVDIEARTASGLIEESQYEELWSRYVTHVSLWLKGERYRDPITGDYSDPDRKLLESVESILDVKNGEEFRRNLISMVAAFALDHPGQAIDYVTVFPRYLDQVKEAYFRENRGRIAATCRDVLQLIQNNGAPLSADAQGSAERARERLHAVGYCDKCLPAVLGELLSERYA